MLKQTTLWQTKQAAGGAASAGFVDLTRGAADSGIRHQAVWLDATVIDDYVEPDPALGRNVGGVVLHVLARHLAACPDGAGEDVITVCLTRREDAAQVEVDLHLTRRRCRGTSGLMLSKAIEREEEFDPVRAA